MIVVIKGLPRQPLLTSYTDGTFISISRELRQKVKYPNFVTSQNDYWNLNNLAL